MNNFTIGLPCYNEEKNIIFCIKQTLESFPDNSNFEILIVDNNSSDNTTKIINEFIKVYNLHNKIKLLKNKKNITYSGSVNKIIKESKFDYVGIMDSDGQYLPKDFIQLFNQLDNGFDLVFGRRVNRSDSFFRKSISFVFKIITKLIINHNLSDLNCGIKVLKRNEMIQNYTTILINHANPELYCTYKSHDLKIGQISVSHSNRNEGKSIHNVFNLVVTFFSVLKYLFFLRKKYLIYK